jgi:hypothetical protein
MDAPLLADVAKRLYMPSTPTVDFTGGLRQL